MKEWSSDHPKAKLMTRKRASILAAAREVFLRLGYGGASMEAIAAAADVSIMTLYRHVDSKDELFAAVIGSACDPDDEAERAAFADLLKQPVPKMLTALGLIAQARLTDPETVKLMRAVMAETNRFPELAEVAYRGFVGHLEDMVRDVLGARFETAQLNVADRTRIAKLFIDRLFGADILRVLLGLSGLSTAQQRLRAERAAAEVLDVIGARARQRIGAPKPAAP